jgi:phenolic acid decarboxylase
MADDIAPAEIILPPAKSTVWETIGKALTLLTVLTAGIGIYTYFFPKTPRLISSVSTTMSDLIPDKVTSKFNLKAKDEIFNGFLESLTPVEKDRFLKNDPAVSKKLQDLTLAQFKAQSDAYIKLISVRQKITVIIGNRGSWEAQDIKVELPVATAGTYRVDFSNEEVKTFERTINIENIRPEGMVFVEIWVNDKSIKSEEIQVTSPEGRVPQSQDNKVTFMDFLALPTLLIENIILLLFLVVILYQKNKNKIKKSGETVFDSDAKETAETEPPR